MTAIHRFARNSLDRLYLVLVFAYFKTQRRILGLKIAAATLKCRVLRLDEPKVLLEDRRRAVFVDKFFEKMKHRKFNSDL
jgi:hypothetical protein